jgi:hypothetical protein
MNQRPINITCWAIFPQRGASTVYFSLAQWFIEGRGPRATGGRYAPAFRPYQPSFTHAPRTLLFQLPGPIPSTPALKAQISWDSWWATGHRPSQLCCSQWKCFTHNWTHTASLVESGPLRRETSHLGWGLPWAMRNLGASLYCYSTGRHVATTLSKAFWGLFKF